MNNEEVVHHWAHQESASGRNGNGSLWFSGCVLYSYETPIAHFIGDRFDSVFITERKYSATTSRHCTLAAKAARVAGLTIERTKETVDEFRHRLHNERDAEMVGLSGDTPRAIVEDRMKEAGLLPM